VDYAANLPYGWSAAITQRGTKQEDKLSPLMFSLVFNALLLALKQSGVIRRFRESAHPPGGLRMTWPS